MISRRHALSVALLLGVAILVVIALAGGLETVDFAPGRTYSTADSRPDLAPDWGGSIGGEIVFPGFDPFKILIPICSALFVVAVGLSIRDKRIRPQLLLSILLLAAAILGTEFALTLQREDLADLAAAEEEDEEEVILPTREGASSAPRIVQPPERVPYKWPVIVTVALAVILIGLVVGSIVLPWFRRRRRLDVSEADQILEIATDAARELEAGEDPIGVVQRCYARMLQALSDRAGVDPTYRTPREFAATLRRVGIGSESVDALTQMFELVRYGGRSDRLFAERAHGCLAALRLSHDAS